MKTAFALCALACGSFLSVAAAPPALSSTSSLTHHITFKGKIDGTDDLMVQNGKLHIQHIDWERPAEMSINGKKWKPVWKDNVSAEFSDFVPALAPFTGATVTVKQGKGRGETVVSEEPSVANGSKLVVRLHDAGNGASEFEVRINW